GTGFIGSHILKNLLLKNVKVRVLARNKNKINKILDSLAQKHYIKNVEIVYGDITIPESYSNFLRNVDTVVNLVGIIREFPRKGITFWKYHYEATKNLVDLALENGVNRFIQMSALGASGTTKSKYYLTKYKAEKYVIESFENWIILRPSIVIGSEGEFTKMIYRMIKIGIVPIIGDGNYVIRPISITTLSNFISYIITENKINRKEFDLVGPREYTFNEFIDSFANAIGKKKYVKIYIPLTLLRVSSKILGRFKFFPITTEQIDLLLKGSTLDYDILEKTTIKNIPIEEEIKKLGRKQL
ncbi:MAG: NAD(P)H-binding protein, partial [Brevinematia bacterium]